MSAPRFVIEGKFLLLSSNKGYEFDAFLEAFSVATEHGVKVEFFGVVEEGRAVTEILEEGNSTSHELVRDLNDRSGLLRFVRRAVPCSFIGRANELGQACDLMNESLKAYKGKSMAVRVEGASFNDPKRTRIISRVSSGIQEVDLKNPDVVAFVYLGVSHFLAGIRPSLSVLGVEDSASFG